MPCATVHLLVARETLDHWSGGNGSPFPLNARTRAAFIHGSMGPDVGFIPGVDRFVSELAHYHRPADLSRAVLKEANTEEQQAYAWGWIAHVLGDVALHPMVGRAVGEAIHGDRSRRMDAAEHLPAHVGMEVGLDIVLLRKHSDIPPPPRSPFFDRSSIGMLGRALEATYGLSWEDSGLLRDHRTAVARTSRWPTALATLGALAPRWRRWPLAPVGAALLGPARALTGPESALRGFLTPLSPPGWLVSCIEAGAADVAERVAGHARAGLDAMENRNLETGEVQRSDETHRGALQARTRLEAELQSVGHS